MFFPMKKTAVEAKGIGDLSIRESQRWHQIFVHACTVINTIYIYILYTPRVLYSVCLYILTYYIQPY